MFPTASKPQQGYSATFLDEIPQDLVCVICSLVLRDPIQVVDCGHRFCSPCFKNFVAYSKDQLLCPIDRQPIEKERVFGDKGMARTIKNLNVKCKNDELGCEWKGHLGDVDSHEACCNYYKAVPKSDQYTALNDLCKQLCERVRRCEEKADMKEKELAYLKYTVKEMKENSSGEEELKILKDEVTYLKLTLKEMKEEAYKSKEQIKTLEESVNKFENEVKIMGREKEEIIQKCTTEVEVLRRKNDALEKQIKTNRETWENESKSCMEASKSFTNQQCQGKFTDDGIIKNLRTQLDNTQKEVRSTRNHLDKSLNKNKNEITEKMVEEMEDLRSHVLCLENTLFCFDCFARNEVELKWIMHNFKENYAVGNDVCSPVFYPQVDGYCFQILVSWSGTCKEDMSVYLKLHRGENESRRNLEPFMHEYTLHIFDKSGGSVRDKTTFSDIKDNTLGCFYIPPRLDEAKLGFGIMINAPFDNYVINDAVYVKCTLDL